jgi:DnaJ-class molecular chaperone
MDTCPYRVLGLSPNAPPEDVKSAYKRLAMRHHPDKNVGNEAEASVRFRSVQSAYDRIREPEASGATLDDLFAGMFGGVPVSRSVQTVRVGISVTTFCKGGTLEVPYGRTSACTRCKGAKGQVASCPTCHGSRYHTWTMGPGLNLRTICPQCEGVGTCVVEACGVCEGCGTQVTMDSIKLRVPAGCSNDHTLQARVPEDTDLRVRIVHEFPKHIVARGQDLVWRERVTLKEVLVGFTRTLRLYAGSSVTLRCAGAMDPSSEYRTKLTAASGNLIVVWLVVWDMAPIRSVRERIVVAFQTRGRTPHPKSTSGSEACP